MGRESFAAHNLKPPSSWHSFQHLFPRVTLQVLLCCLYCFLAGSPFSYGISAHFFSLSQVISALHQGLSAYVRTPGKNPSEP